MPSRWLVRIVVALSGAVLGTVLWPSLSVAQSRPPVTTPPAVMAPVKLTKEAATAAALRHVPGARLQAIALGLINGKSVYTAFLLMPERPGRITVVIDANTGAVVRKTP